MPSTHFKSKRKIRLQGKKKEIIFITLSPRIKFDLHWQRFFISITFTNLINFVSESKPTLTHVKTIYKAPSFSFRCQSDSTCSLLSSLRSEWRVALPEKKKRERISLWTQYVNLLGTAIFKFILRKCERLWNDRCRRHNS